MIIWYLEIKGNNILLVIVITENIIEKYNQFI